MRSRYKSDISDIYIRYKVHSFWCVTEYHATDGDGRLETNLLYKNTFFYTFQFVYIYLINSTFHIDYETANDFR